MCSAEQAAGAMLVGLKDRSAKPQAAARKMLQSWLTSSCDDNPVVLLQHLDAINNEGHSPPFVESGGHRHYHSTVVCQQTRPTRSETSQAGRLHLVDIALPHLGACNKGQR